jgi:hypothetical protein
MPNQSLSSPVFMGIEIGIIKGGCNAMNHNVLRGEMERLFGSRAAHHFF